MASGLATATRPLVDEGWPTAAQRLVLRAALAPGGDGLGAWREWQGRTALDDLEPGTFPVLPRLYLRLRDAAPAEPELAKLKGIYRFAWGRNEVALRALGEALEALRAAGIGALVTGGVPLASLQREPGARPIARLDIAVRAEDVERAVEAACRAGWSPGRRLPGKALRPFTTVTHLSRPHRVPLALAWSPLGTLPAPLEDAALWERAETRALAGGEALVPEATDLLLAACLEGRRSHPETRCQWALDAVDLAAGARIDWEALLERAARRRLLLAVRDALTFLRAELGAPVPDEVHAAAWRREGEAGEAALYRDLRRDAQPAGGPLESIARQWRRFAEGRRLGGRRSGLAGFLRYALTYAAWRQSRERGA
jgi:hypothetical protein